MAIFLKSDFQLKMTTKYKRALKRINTCLFAAVTVYSCCEVIAQACKSHCYILSLFSLHSLSLFSNAVNAVDSSFALS